MRCPTCSVLSYPHFSCKNFFTIKLFQNLLARSSRLFLPEEAGKKKHNFGDIIMVGVYEIGRVCVKTTGREAGSYGVVVDVIDKNYALIEGLKIRRRRVNFKHLEPVEEKVDIKKGASDKDLAAAIKKVSGLEAKMNSTVKISPI